MSETDIILPSSFRSRITVKVPVTLQDAAGGIATNGYTEQYSTFAYVENLSTSRALFYGMDLFQSGWKVVLRYNATRLITTGTVIEYSGMNFIVKSTQLATQPYKRFLILICQQSEVQ